MDSITILRNSCKGVEDCGICTFVCPKGLFQACSEMNELGYLPPELKNEADCTGCQNCMLYCPDFAIVVEKTSEASTNDVEVADA